MESSVLGLLALVAVFSVAVLARPPRKKPADDIVYNIPVPNINETIKQDDIVQRGQGNKNTMMTVLQEVKKRKNEPFVADDDDYDEDDYDEDDDDASEREIDALLAEMEAYEDDNFVWNLQRPVRTKRTKRQVFDEYLASHKPIPPPQSAQQGKVQQEGHANENTMLTVLQQKGTRSSRRSDPSGIENVPFDPNPASVLKNAMNSQKHRNGSNTNVQMVVQQTGLTNFHLQDIIGKMNPLYWLSG